jgi:hypothetical protein
MEAAAPPTKHIDPGRVIGETFDVYKSHFAVLIVTALAVFVVAGLIQGLATEIDSILGSLLGAAVNLIAVALYTGFVVKLVEDIRDGRRDFTAGELLSAASPALGALIVNSILRGIGIVIGFILLIIPGLYLLTIWSVTSPAIVAERQGAIAAFGRSHELVKGDGWPVFATIVLAFLITLGVSIVAAAIGAGLGTGGAIVMGIIASALTAPVAALVASVLFFDLGGSSSDPGAAAPATAPPPPAA